MSTSVKLLIPALGRQRLDIQGYIRVCLRNKGGWAGRGEYE